MDQVDKKGPPYETGIGECVRNILPRETFHAKWKENKFPDYQKEKATKIGEKLKKYKEKRIQASHTPLL